jgi:hypothetical protein
MEPFEVPSIFYLTVDGPAADHRQREHSMSKDHKDKPDEMTATSDSAAIGNGGSRKMDKGVQTAIGTRLRAYYDEVAREEIPDRFVELLKQLETKDPDGKA